MDLPCLRIVPCYNQSFEFNWNWRWKHHDLAGFLMHVPSWGAFGTRELQTFIIRLKFKCSVSVSARQRVNASSSIHEPSLLQL